MQRYNRLCLVVVVVVMTAATTVAVAAVVTLVISTVGLTNLSRTGVKTFVSI